LREEVMNVHWIYGETSRIWLYSKSWVWNQKFTRKKWVVTSVWLTIT